MDIKKLYGKVKSKEITENQFLYEVRRDLILKKFITGQNSFKDAIQILKNKGLVKEYWNDGDWHDDAEYGDTPDTDLPIKGDEEIGHQFIDREDVENAYEEIEAEVRASHSEQDNWDNDTVPRVYGDKFSDEVDERFLTKYGMYPHEAIAQLPGSGADEPAEEDDDMQSWIDPAGGTHSSDEEDPADVYRENGPDDEEEGWDEPENPYFPTGGDFEDDEIPTDYGDAGDYNDGEFWETKGSKGIHSQGDSVMNDPSPESYRDTRDKKTLKSISIAKKNAERELRNLKEGKEAKLTIDQVNPYEFKKGLHYELGATYTSITDVDTSPETVKKAKNKVLKNLSKDPYYYHNKISGQSIKSSEPIFVKDDNKKDKENAIAKAKGQKIAKSNVKDTLGKKEAGKKTIKGIKILAEPGEKYTKARSLKEMLEGEPIIEKKRIAVSMQDKVELLYEAQDLINEAIGLIEEAVSGTGVESSANAYIIAHLNNWANGENPYDQSIPRIIEELEEGDEDDLDEVDITSPDIENKRKASKDADMKLKQAELNALRTSR